VHIPTSKALHFGELLSQQDHTIHTRELRHDLAERRSNLARLIGYAVRFLHHNVRMTVRPLRGPVFDLNNPNARRANCDDIDFIGLELMGDGESEIRQQNPFVIALYGLQAACQLIEGQ
jgi:hypothetical protein